MSAIRVATWNVNSINARAEQALAWVDAARPDVVLLQEIKCVDEAFPAEPFAERGYNLALHGQKTYNGVAILSKFPLEEVIRGLPGDDTDIQARYLEATLSVRGTLLRVASIYVPNGQSPDSDKFAYKLRFLERLSHYWSPRMAADELIVLGGDYNCAPAARDVYDAAALAGTVCFHPEERRRLQALTHLGFYDAYRALNPAGAGFTWWDYRAGAFARNQGLRIDHLLLNAPALDRALACEIDLNPRYNERPSDHAPVVVQITA